MPSGGHLDVLKWARENGCPWDSRTVTLAMSFSNENVLDWARENGCPEFAPLPFGLE